MKLKNGLLALATTLSIVTNVTASDVDEVCYVPIRGEGLTSCTPIFDAEGNIVDECSQTLGVYKLVFKKSTTGPSKIHLRLAGPLVGTANPDRTFNHILGDQHARGLLYTFGDTIIEAIPSIEDPYIVHVKEELYVSFGTGKYAGAHGTFTVTGVLNSLSGVNEFDVVRNEGEICFSGSEPDEDDDD